MKLFFFAQDVNFYSLRLDALRSKHPLYTGRQIWVALQNAHHYFIARFTLIVQVAAELLSRVTRALLKLLVLSRIFSRPCACVCPVYSILGERGVRS